MSDEDFRKEVAAHFALLEERLQRLEELAIGPRRTRRGGGGPSRTRGYGRARQQRVVGAGDLSQRTCPGRTERGRMRTYGTVLFRTEVAGDRLQYAERRHRALRRGYGAARRLRFHPLGPPAGHAGTGRAAVVVIVSEVIGVGAALTRPSTFTDVAEEFAEFAAVAAAAAVLRYLYRVELEEISPLRRSAERGRADRSLPAARSSNGPRGAGSSRP